MGVWISAAVENFSIGYGLTMGVWCKIGGVVSCGNLCGYGLAPQKEIFFSNSGVWRYTPYGIGEGYTTIQMWYFEENYVAFCHKTLDFLLDMREHLLIFFHLLFWTKTMWILVKKLWCSIRYLKALGDFITFWRKIFEFSQKLLISIRYWKSLGDFTTFWRALCGF